MRSNKQIKKLAEKSIEKPKTATFKDRVFINISYIVIGAALALVGVVSYWSLQPAKIYEVEGNIMQVVPPKVRAGESVEVRFSFCKLVEDSGILRKSIIGEGVEVFMPTIYEQIGMTCIKNVSSTIYIPPQVGTGTYRIKYTAEYEINPIRAVVETYYSDEFEVIGNPR